MKIFLDPSVLDLEEVKDLQLSFNIKKKESINSDEAILVFAENTLKLISLDKKPVFCDFLDQAYLREVQQGYGRAESIFKFLKAKERLKILDLTLGFGRDFFKGVLCGHEMTGLERDPLVYSLVKDGTRRFYESKESQALKEKFKLKEFKARIFQNDAETYLENCNDFDIIFYDPMFDKSSKSGKAKKSIQLLREVIKVNSKDEVFKVIDLGRKRTKQFVLKSDASFEVNKEEVLFVHKGKGFKFISFK